MLNKSKQLALLMALTYGSATPADVVAKALEHLGVDSYDFTPNPGPELKKLQKAVEGGAPLTEELLKLECFDEEVKFLVSVSLQLAVEYLLSQQNTR
jgi:hypothetical protein